VSHRAPASAGAIPSRGIAQAAMLRMARVVPPLFKPIR